MKRKTLAIALGAALSASLAATAQADKLDDIIESGKLLWTFYSTRKSGSVMT